ncbi:MAG: hypothetical protein ABSB78_13400 [Bacteroidota bacterium]
MEKSKSLLILYFLIISLLFAACGRRTIKTSCGDFKIGNPFFQPVQTEAGMHNMLLLPISRKDGDMLSVDDIRCIKQSPPYFGSTWDSGGGYDLRYPWYARSKNGEMVLVFGGAHVGDPVLYWGENDPIKMKIDESR